MYSKKTFHIVHGAVIAALYIVLSLFAGGLDLASGAIQCRFSEALAILPFFTPAAIPGLTIGCLISNFILGSPAPDIIFGTLATFLGATGTYYLRHTRFLFMLPPIVSNALIIPFVLKYSYGAGQLIPYLIFTVGAGESIAVIIFGGILLKALSPLKFRLFNSNL